MEIDRPGFDGVTVWDSAPGRPYDHSVIQMRYLFDRGVDHGLNGASFGPCGFGPRVGGRRKDQRRDVRRETVECARGLP
jgi:hypothetical protein